MVDRSWAQGQANSNPVPTVEYNRHPDVLKLIIEAVRYQRNKGLIQALEKYKAAIRLDPRDPELMQLYGCLLLQLKDDQAVPVLEEAYLLTGGLPFVGYNLALALRQVRRYAEAQVYVERYLEVAPKDTTAWLVLSECHVWQGRYDKAREFARKTILMGRNDQLAWEHVADSYRKAGEAEHACYVYEYILQRWPSSHGTRINLALEQLTCQNYLAGFINYEARHLVNPNQCEGHPFTTPEWLTVRLPEQTDPAREAGHQDLEPRHPALLDPRMLAIRLPQSSDLGL